MPATHQFDYLPLVLREHGPARYPQAPQPEDPTTATNKANRTIHGGGLRTHTSRVSADWQARQQARVQNGLPPITGTPLLLKIDTSLDLDDLRRQFEFEIVSEQEDGFVIVASEDVDLTLFQQRLADFISSVSGSANVAKIHELREDLTQEDRLKLILTDSLFQEWPSIADDSQYICDVSIACVGTWEIPKKPKPNPRWKDETWAQKENDWSNRRLEAYEKWDALKDQLECWVQNARVLDNGCRMPETMFPPSVLREVVKRYHEGNRHTRIFNHSINADAPYDVRIDVTLSYASVPRRTRRTPQGYLATWLNWISNGRGEPFSDFRDRAVKRDTDPPKSPGAIGWTIESRSNWGTIRDIRRNVGTVQKDWCVKRFAHAISHSTGYSY